MKVKPILGPMPCHQCGVLVVFAWVPDELVGRVRATVDATGKPHRCQS